MPNTNATQMAFPSGHQSIRTISLEGAPWFSGADVCRQLGYRIAPGRDVGRNLLRRLDRTEWRLVSEDGARRVVYLSESGIFRLILRSGRPEAQSFIRWVSDAILPTIAAHGTYIRGADIAALREQVAPLTAERATPAAAEWPTPAVIPLIREGEAVFLPI